MAVRRPVYLNSGNIQEMDDTMFGALKNVFRYQFQSANPISLSVVSSGGNLGTIVDTRMIAGESNTRTDRFATEAETDDVSQTSVSYSRISQNVGASGTLGTDDGKRYFCYIDTNNNIQAMTHQDMLDSIVRPVILELATGQNNATTAGTYFIDTTSALQGGQEVVSSTPVFLDTRADVSAYTDSGIGETQDQPTTITSYYLKRNIISAPSMSVLPLQIRSDNDVQEFSVADVNTMANELMRHEVVASASTFKIRYNLGGSGANKGSGMTDTRLNGTGNYQQRYVNTNDYRAQEFPNGTAVTIGTTFLKIDLT